MKFESSFTNEKKRIRFKEGGTGLTGHSGQEFDRVDEIDLDKHSSTTITVRLVGFEYPNEESNNKKVTPLRDINDPDYRGIWRKKRNRKTPIPVHPLDSNDLNTDLNRRGETYWRDDSDRQISDIFDGLVPWRMF